MLIDNQLSLIGKNYANNIFSRVMIHQPASSYYDGQAGECMMEGIEILKLRDSITRVYAQRTGKPIWVISEDMERDAFMSAEEARAYGIVDLVTADSEQNTDTMLLDESN
jgi:ATP-dependent Clp protease protease subunit